MKKVKQVFAVLVCALALSMPFGITAFAGRTGNVVVSDSDFVGTELDFSDWRYDRGGGIEFRETMRCLSFDSVMGDCAITSKTPVPSSSGSAVDIEIVKLDLRGGGWIGPVYGSTTAGYSQGAFWDCSHVGGLFHTFNQSSSKVEIIPYKFAGNDSGEAADETFIADKFEDGEGQVVSDLVLEGSEAVVANTTLREYYGHDGSYELSVREIGAPVSERHVLLKTKTGSSLAPNPGGYVGLAFMSLRNPLVITDFAVYECNDATKENSELNKLCGFVKNGEEDALSQYNPHFPGGVENLKSGIVNSIAFGKNSDIGNPLLNRSRIYASEEAPVALSGSFSVKVNELVGNKRFGAVFGIPSLGSDIGDDGTSHLYFSKNGTGLDVGLSYYGDKEKQLLPPTALNGVDFGDEIEVALDLYANGKLDFSVNGTAVYSGKAGDINTEGYFGFAQSGSFTDTSNYINAEIVSMSLLNEYYAKPVAPDVFTDFNDNSLNVNEWYLKYGAFLGSGINVKNGALVFDGAGQNSGITSRYSYSNFELKFDISGAKNKPTLDGGGNVVSGASYWVGVTFGAETESAESAGTSSSQTYGNGSFVYFDCDTDVNTGARIAGAHTSMMFIYKGNYMKLPEQQDVGIKLPSKYAFLDENFDSETVVTIRITVLDGVMRVGLKLKDEAEFYELAYFVYPESYTPNGHVSIFGEGNDNVSVKKVNRGTFCTIDNLGLYNWDENGNTVDVEYRSNVPEFAEDYDYIDTWAETVESSEQPKGCSGNVAASVPAALCAPIIGLCALGLAKRRKV